MRDHDIYKAWKQKRSEPSVPDDFADGIIAVLRLREQRLGQRLSRMLRSLFLSPSFRVGVCSLGCAVALLRILQVVVVFMAEQASR
jgi:hypothetical protein